MRDASVRLEKDVVEAVFVFRGVHVKLPRSVRTDLCVNERVEAVVEIAALRCGGRGRRRESMVPMIAAARNRNLRMVGSPIDLMVKGPGVAKQAIPGLGVGDANGRARSIDGDDQDGPAVWVRSVDLCAIWRPRQRGRGDSIG